MGAGSTTSKKNSKNKSQQTGQDSEYSYFERAAFSPPTPEKFHSYSAERRPDQHKPSTRQSHESWPLPSKIQREDFKVESFDDHRYSLPIKPGSPVPSDPPETIQASNSVPHKKKETSTDDWKIVDSQSDQSAHVQSQLTAHSESLFKLSSSADIDVLFQNLKQTYKLLDDRVKRRLDEVSVDADEMLKRIVDDANKERDALLMYDKEQQKVQSDLYQEWLQKYVVELNKWRSRELAELQQELRLHQKKIADNSQKYIEKLSKDTNNRKLDILTEEQTHAREKTKDLTDKIHEIVSTGGLQLLGSESKTEFNLRIQSNVGRMSP